MKEASSGESGEEEDRKKKAATPAISRMTANPAPPINSNLKDFFGFWGFSGAEAFSLSMKDGFLLVITSLL